MEKERAPKFTISEMTQEDIDAATEMRLASWLDTYPSAEHGVERGWIEERNRQQRSPEIAASRRERFNAGKMKKTLQAWVARDVSGKIVGSTTPFIDEDGSQHVGSLYVDKAWHGTGVGSSLMQKVIDWFDPTKDIELGVVSYNERAKAFYRKWGFKEVISSETLFAEKIPEVKMIRKGVKS